MNERVKKHDQPLMMQHWLAEALGCGTCVRYPGKLTSLEAGTSLLLSALPACNLPRAGCRQVVWTAWLHDRRPVPCPST